MDPAGQTIPLLSKTETAARSTQTWASAETKQYFSLLGSGVKIHKVSAGLRSGFRLLPEHLSLTLSRSPQLHMVGLIPDGPTAPLWSETTAMGSTRSNRCSRWSSQQLVIGAV